MSDETPDAIVKHIFLAADLSRVWQAIANSDQFGKWFGMWLKGPFIAGQEITGTIQPTEVNAEVAAMQEPHRGTPVSLVVEEMDPPHVFSFRWRPFAIDKDKDYSAEPMTLVRFELEAVTGGTNLTITESGFHGIPLERRAQAFAADDGGWTWQCKLIEAYLARGW